MANYLVPRSIVRLLILGGHRSCYFSTNRRLMPPIPPLEKKWFYKEVWSALQSKEVPRNISQEFKNSKLPLAFKSDALPDSWSQRFITVRDRGVQLTEEYELRKKLSAAFQKFCGFVTAIKDFFCQSRYKQIGPLMDNGLKRLEDKIRITREGRKLGHEDHGAKQTDSCIKTEDAAKH